MNDKTSKTHDPDVLTAEMVAASNRLETVPGAGLGQGLALIAGAGFSIAAAIRDLAAAVREGKAP